MCVDFRPTTAKEVEQIIKNIDSHKSQPESDLPSNIIKLSSGVFAEFISKSINHSFEISEFPDVLKLSTIIPLHKKCSKNDKSNYRPISILPVISKIYERIYPNQLSEYFKNFFNDQQCGFRKNFSTQTTLLSMEELWKLCNDKKEFFGALLIDLSKAFDCMSHELLIAKIEAYGLNHQASKLIANYLQNRRQRSKIENEQSDWHITETGVPQGSILGPLLLNIYICDLFFDLEDLDVVNIANYADDTPFARGRSWEEVRTKLNNTVEIIFAWFSNNQMICNAEKCKLITNNRTLKLSITIEGKTIFNNATAKILGITFDNLLTFENHIVNLCRTASQKISALARISPYMSISKRRKIMNAFFMSHFNYCQMIWMFYSRSLEHRINRLHERCLRIVYSDQLSTFKDLLVLDGNLTIHQRTIQTLAIEMFKVKNGRGRRRMRRGRGSGKKSRGGGRTRTLTPTTTWSV